MSVNAAKPTVRQKCSYGNMAESELLCVRVATLLRKKCKHNKSDVKAVHVRIVNFFFF